MARVPSPTVTIGGMPKMPKMEMDAPAEVEMR